MIFLSVSLAMKAQESFLITGTYTSGKSEGIYVHRFNPANADQSAVGKATGIKNPSFLCLSPDRNHVYAVSESNDQGHGGKVFAYSLNRHSGYLLKLNEQPSGGDDPCYVTVDRSGKWVIVGNYSSGNLSILPILKGGSLGEAVTRISHQGTGFDKRRQDKPHVHETVISADNKFIYVPDLGLDKVYIYSFDAASGKAVPASMPYAEVKAGTGPRHIIFHATLPYAYIIQELTGTVTVFRVDKKTGSLKIIQSISSLPSGFNGDAGSADIHISPDGRFLYASNRGTSNTIAVFEIDKSNGKVSIKGTPSSLGIHPRNFCFDPSGDWLLVANRDSDQVVVFRVDKKTGMISDTGKRINIPSPVCLIWSDMTK